MYKYSNETLKKYPWKWKYDSRFRRSCHKRGHKFHWNKAIQTSTYLLSIGFCIYCTHVCQAAVHCDRTKRIVKVIKVFEEPEVITLTKENVTQLRQWLLTQSDQMDHGNGVGKPGECA